MCSRENKKVAYTHTHTPFSYITKFYMFLFLYITDYLIGFRYVIWSETKRTNKILALMNFGHFYQLLTSPKLPLIIFNTTI